MPVFMDGLYFDALAARLRNKADQIPEGPEGEFIDNVLSAMAYLADAFYYWDRGEKEDKAFAEDRVREALAVIKQYEKKETSQSGGWIP